MPLDRDHVTIASRVMLPAYVLADLLFGVAFVLPGSRPLRAPALGPARDVLPLAVWGGIWLAVAVVMAAALLRRSRLMFTFALSTNAVAWFLWGCLLEAAVLSQPAVTYLACVLPWFVAVASIASMQSLLREEIR